LVKVAGLSQEENYDAVLGVEANLTESYLLLGSTVSIDVVNRCDLLETLNW